MKRSGPPPFTRVHICGSVSPRSQSTHRWSHGRDRAEAEAHTTSTTSEMISATATDAQMPRGSLIKTAIHMSWTARVSWRDAGLTTLWGSPFNQVNEIPENKTVRAAGRWEFGHLPGNTIRVTAGPRIEVHCLLEMCRIRPAPRGSTPRRSGGCWFQSGPGSVQSLFGQGGGEWRDGQSPAGWDTAVLGWDYSRRPRRNRQPYHVTCAVLCCALSLSH